MRQTTYRTHVNRSPEVVSAFLANLLYDKEWRREVVETRLISGVAGNVGAKYREALTWEGLRAPASLTVADYEEGSRLVVIAEDPGYRATYEYNFNRVGDGTDVALAARVEMSGPLQLVEPFLWAMVDRWMERGIDRLDRVLSERGEGQT